MKVLVVGATGALGRPVMQRLRACAGVQRVLAAAHGFVGRGPWRSEAVDDAGHRTLIVAARYARAAGIEPSIGRLPVAVARPLHPGMARIMRIFALPDDAFSETFEGAAALEREHGVRLTPLADFIAARVAEASGRRPAG